MSLDHLWVTWRSAYVDGAVASRRDATDGPSVFEELVAADGEDRELGVVHRGATCFVLLNRFPYTAGATMVLPNRAVADLEDLTAVEHDELWALVRTTVVATKAALRPDACNVGVNLGAAAGGSLSDHLHVHVVPRWIGDANFMTAVAETRTLPISLPEAWDRLTAAWPAGAAAGAVS